MRNTIDRPFRRARGGVALLALAVAATACIDHDTPIAPTAQPLFERYVALGNSITAGFQSDGLTAGSQQDAYPAILAEMANASFGIPLMAAPGCPPPLVGPLTTERTNSTVPCALRAFPVPNVVQNLAVPGANISHALHPLGTGSTLNTLILGGRTQVQAMLDARPSLVSVWLGNNDALRAAIFGDTLLVHPGTGAVMARLTPLAEFQAAYSALVERINASTAQEVILIGVANAAAMAPILQPGAYFWGLAQSGQSPIPLQVDDNCAPGTAGGARMVSFAGLAAQLAQNPQGPVVINCAAEAPFLLNETELQVLGARIAGYNAHIQAAAEANGWIYVDPMTEMFIPALQNPDQVRKCQGLATATTPEEFGAAIMNTCPVPTAPNFFGSYFSFDGVHPSSAAHAVVAEVLAGRLAEKHGLNLN
jgi:lysophospholipase L1-like esterase